MFVRISKLAAIAVVSASLSACAFTNQFAGPEDAMFNDNRVNPAGANQILHKDLEYFDNAALYRLMCSDATTLAAVKSVPDALQCFHSKTAAGDKVMRRNEAQAALILASNQRCNVWYTYLERAGAINRGTFNVLSTITGGVGGIVTGTAAQALSATSGIASGAGASIDAALFHGLAEGIMIPTVMAARTQKLTALQARKAESIDTYSMSMALADAVDYHGLCNVRTALDKNAQVASFTMGMETFNKAAAIARGGLEVTDADVAVGAVFKSKGALLRVITVAAAVAGPPAVPATVTYQVSVAGADYGANQTASKDQFLLMVDRTVCSPAHC